MISEFLKNEKNRFVLIKPKDKAPFEKGWQNDANYSYNDPILLNHINSGGNYGLVTGFNNIICIDFDNKEYQDKIIKKLPDTFTVRSGSGLLHCYYYIDDPESFKILNTHKETILDFQGKGKQIVCANSTHPNGNIYKIIKNQKIEKIELNFVKALFYSQFPHQWLPKSWETNDIRQVRKENSNNLISEIKRNFSIKDLLNENGINTSQNPTKCPLHSNGRKNLGFNEEIWHCFNCGEKGDVISLYQLINKLDFKQAIKELCQKLNIEYKPFEFEKKRFSKNLAEANDRLSQMETFIEENPIFYDPSKIWWVWSYDENHWIMVDETDILNVVRKELDIRSIINSKIKNEILESLKQLGREKKPKDPPLEWIQFKNYIYDLKNKKKIIPSPEYFFTNPIQWDLGENSQTPIIDELLISWVGEKYKDLMYEIIAYSLYRDYPIHRIFCFTGSGRNGKSKFLGLIKKFIGTQNTTSTELDILISNRFESAKLYKKLVCQLGETNDNALQDTALLKKLSGQDTIGYEFKNKNPFDDINYSKIIIATNNLPTTLDKSDGFYRRWLIIDFPNQFPEGKDILSTIPNEEYSNLALKSINYLQNLLENEKFTNEPTIEQKKEIYEEKSSPITFFIKEKCELHPNKQTKMGELYQDFSSFIRERGYKDFSYNQFSSKLRDEGYHIEMEHFTKNDGTRSTRRVVVGVAIKKNESGYEVDTLDTHFQTLFPIRKIVEICVSSVSTQIQFEELLRICRGQIPNLEYIEFEKTIENMKKEGEIIEMPKGYIRRI